jgi:hypothetical protein
MTPIEKRIAKLQIKMDLQTQKIAREIQSICDKLGYQDGSRFSYNIDRIERFNKELQEFKLLNK